MISSSIRCSFTGVQVGWTTKMSRPRTSSSIFTWVSPSGKLLSEIWPSESFNSRAIFWDNSGLARPLKTFSFDEFDWAGSIRATTLEKGCRANGPVMLALCGFDGGAVNQDRRGAAASFFLATRERQRPESALTPVADASGSPKPIASEAQHERDEVLLLLVIQLQFQNQIEELHRVFEGQQAAVVQVRRRVLDAAQRERLDRAVRRGRPAVIRPRFEE